MVASFANKTNITVSLRLECIGWNKKGILYLSSHWTFKFYIHGLKISIWIIQMYIENEWSKYPMKYMNIWIYEIYETNDKYVI